MPPELDENDPDNLIAELPAWNDGNGPPVDAQSWIEMTGTYELAIGYSLVFWPRFIRFEDYVLRAGRFSEANLRNWERTHPGRRQVIEAVLNHLHIADLHCNDQTLTEAQCRYLGRTLRAAWETKLKLDFPDLTFEVVFNDEPGLDLTDYQLAFWQRDEVPTTDSDAPS